MAEEPSALTESLLDDLDDLSDVEEEISPNKEQDHDSNKDINNHNNMEVDSSTAVDTDTINNAIDPESNIQLDTSCLDDNKGLDEHLSIIREMSSSSNYQSKHNKKSEHELIVDSNKYLADLITGYMAAHAVLCRAYEPKFPELEELLVDPRQYKAAVFTLQNEMDITLKNEELLKFLTSNQVLTMSVAGSTTSGRLLTEPELAMVMKIVEYIDRIEHIQRELTTFVENRMNRIAPNISEIVGTAIAAKLVGLAGGLAELSRTPACNIQLFGQVKATGVARAGMSSASTKPHQGIISQCDLVQNAHPDLKVKVMKAVSAKVSLAARVDYSNEGKTSLNKGYKISSDTGKALREEIVSKISKWMEPEKARTSKALPKPDLSTKKRRGGKRVRRKNERFQTTELQKQANKRGFNAEIGEYGDDAMGLTLGMLDSKEGGNLRQNVEAKKMRISQTKAARKKAIKMSSGTASGLASSMVFTPVQGLELVNPEANKDRVREANMKWFSQNSGFQSAKPKK